jgi:pseudouridine synthase
MKERLQKILARAGVASRRASETLIASGHVTVNGEPVTELGVKVDPETDRIEVDGRPIRLTSEHVYLALNKPKGVVTTAHDERGRVSVLDLIETSARVFPVGRLDRDSEGLLLLMNDGELAARLTHPRYGLEKEYVVRVPLPPSDEALRLLAEGIELDGTRTAPARVARASPPRAIKAKPDEHWVQVVVHEGRKRQVRRMLAAQGIPTLRLIRVRIGPLRIGELPPGESRPLTNREVESLRRATGLEGEAVAVRDATQNDTRHKRRRTTH